MITDLTFAQSYSAKIRPELPGVSPEALVHHFPDRGLGADGIIVQVVPENRRPWVGVFAFGQLSRRNVNALCACPDGLSICVVSQGAGYVVRADNPVMWESILLDPILIVRVVVENNLLLLATDYDMVAYGPNGFAWRSSRLVDDELAITDVSNGVIRGTGWSAPQQRVIEFAINEHTGTPVE